MRVKVNMPLTAKPREIRMGKGKGEVSQHVRYIIRGQILFEIAAGKQNRSILLIAKRKLPLLTRIIERFDQI
jgi:large subunit ribosomal protein L16